MKCEICGREITPIEAHNGQPLVKGKVCGTCNWKVIRERLRLAKATPPEPEKPATESMAVIGTDGPVTTVDPMADFEKYAKQFKETFLLGETPVRKEVPQNKTKVSGDGVTGEVDSMEKGEKNNQPEPFKKSATEGEAGAGVKLGGSYQTDDLGVLLKMAQNIGLRTGQEFLEFSARERKPGESLYDAMIRYRASLGNDHKNPTEF